MSKELHDEFGSFSTWDEESFEDEVSAAIISLYETTITGQKRNHPSQRITDSILSLARTHGVYIPNGNRLIFEGIFDTGYQLPNIATLSLDATKSERNNEPNNISGYRNNVYVRKIDNLPRNYTRMGGGQLYMVAVMVAKAEGGMNGRVGYISIDKDGKGHPCDFRFGASSQSKIEHHCLEENVFHGLNTLNYWSDKINSWTIDAQESEARCIVGVDKEQVKSLLYARSLPLTATGRKRPILHLVASHQRRLKAGIDIQIDEFLRGVRKVEMNGTIFTVQAPDVISQRLKKS